MRHKLLTSLYGLIALGASIGLSAQGTAAVEISTPKGVVELFTSQGCYSCPPADKIIGKFSKSNEILGLGWHVDYWDYLGWKDIFASKSNTERQYRYARALRERQVYTPQAIINGRIHAVGSQEGKIRSAVSSFENTDEGLTVPLNVVMKGDNLAIDVGHSSLSKKSTLWLVYFNKAQKVNIERGENRGKVLTYHNVVHDIQMLGMVKAAGLSIELPVAEMKRQGFDSCALILQTNDKEGNPGPIVGASVITDL